MFGTSLAREQGHLERTSLSLLSVFACLLQLIQSFLRVLECVSNRLQADQPLYGPPTNCKTPANANGPEAGQTSAHIKNVAF